MKTGWRKNYLRQKGYFMNIMRDYKEKADVKMYLEILLSLLTVSVFAVFALRPTLLTIAELLREIDSKKEVLAQMNDKIANLTGAQILYDQKRNQITTLKTSLEDYPSTDVIIRQFEGLSSETGIPLVNLSLGEAPLKGNPVLEESVKSEKKVQNSLSVSSAFNSSPDNYSSLSLLVNKFENLRIPFKINRLSITVSNVDQEEIVLTNIDGFVYYNQKTPK